MLFLRDGAGRRGAVQAESLALDRVPAAWLRAKSLELSQRAAEAAFFRWMRAALTP